ncbi:MAG: class I SAM-dependent methyltransferase [Acidobacteriota bacterium]
MGRRVWLALALLAATWSGGAAAAGAEEKATPDHLDRSVLADPGRPQEERAQDPSRKAIDVYEWLGVRPGMTVGDLFASGGYNTHLLSRVVGDQGKVLSIFEFYADKKAFGGRLYKVDAVRERVAKNGLENVELVTKLTDVTPESVDVMLAVRNYHDVEWVFPGLKRKDVVAAAYRALKPGGIMGIVDVATPKPGWDQAAHRLNEKVVIEDFTAGGFELAGQSDMLRNPDDDHDTTGFEAGRHTMDRYLLKFRKPRKKS